MVMKPENKKSSLSLWLWLLFAIVALIIGMANQDILLILAGIVAAGGVFLRTRKLTGNVTSD